MNEVAAQKKQKLPSFLGWWLAEMPINYWYMATRIARRTLIFFSVPQLIRTLFAPWKRDAYVPRGGGLDVIVKAIMDNFISRGIGFVVRFFTVVVGVFAAAASFIALVLLMLFWLLMPVIILTVLIRGLR